jgi:hypothetical protein
MFSCHSNSASAQPGPRGARYVVRCQHGRKVGARRWRRSRCGQIDQRRWLPRRHNQGGGFRVGYPKTLGQRLQGPAGSVPQGAQSGLQSPKQHVNPLIGLALVDPEQPCLYHLGRRGLQIDQDKPQPSLGRRQRTRLIGGVPAGRVRLPIEAPVGHLGLRCGLKRRDQPPKLI